MRPWEQLEAFYQEGAELLDRAVSEPVLSQETFEAIDSFCEQLVRHTALHPEIALDWATNTTVENGGYLVDHLLNVALFAGVYGIEVGYSDDALLIFVISALLHDLGMFDLPYVTIYGTETFSDEQRAEMQTHPYLGVRRLEHLESLPEDVVFIVRDEHERMDGSGYPEQKTGPTIHPLAKSLQVLDIYEALIHTRPYRDAPMPPQQAMRQLILLAQEGVLDRTAVKHWLNRLTYYPIASIVRLNNGAVGKVVSYHPERPLQPTVAVFLNAQGEPIESPRIIDLTERMHLHVAEGISQPPTGDLPQPPLEADLASIEAASTDDQVVPTGPSIH